MVTVLIISGVLSVIVGLWLLNKKQNDDLKEINANVHPWVDDLAPESTPAVEAEKLAKKKATPKKKTVTKKTPVKKVAKKNNKK